MKFYTFGNKENKTFLLLPTRLILWDKLFSNAINLLKKDYYVIVASYDGFDKEEKTMFISVMDEVKKIENFIASSFDRRIFACYASSFGGKILGKLIERDNIKIDNAIFGSPEFLYNFPILSKIKAELFSKESYKLLNKGEISDFEKFLIETKNNKYIEEMYKLMGYNTKDYSFVSYESIYNEYYTDLRTNLNKKLNYKKNVKIFIFYAMKMGKKVLKKYVKYFENPDIIYQNYEEEELLILNTEKWIQEIQNCLK